MKDIVKNRIVSTFNILMLLGSLTIIINISIQILVFQNYNPQNSKMYVLQLVVCTIFLLDFLVRIIFTTEPRWRFFWKNILLLLFSIPYLNIIHYSHIEVPAHQYYLLNLIPLFRSAFAFTIILRWVYGRGSSTLLAAYLSFLAVAVYICSLIFFVAEKDINPEVKTWYDAIWWACMDMDTVGSNIIAITPIGKILSVILACLGMMMLPVFTVFITDKIAERVKANKEKKKKEGTPANFRGRK